MLKAEAWEIVFMQRCTHLATGDCQRGLPNTSNITWQLGSKWQNMTEPFSSWSGACDWVTFVLGKKIVGKTVGPGRTNAQLSNPKSWDALTATIQPHAQRFWCTNGIHWTHEPLVFGWAIHPSVSPRYVLCMIYVSIIFCLNIPIYIYIYIYA